MFWPVLLVGLSAGSDKNNLEDIKKQKKRQGFWHLVNFWENIIWILMKNNLAYLGGSIGSIYLGSMSEYSLMPMLTIQTNGNLMKQKQKQNIKERMYM